MVLVVADSCTPPLSSLPVTIIFKHIPNQSFAIASSEKTIWSLKNSSDSTANLRNVG
jgi:hypothetical protein